MITGRDREILRAAAGKIAEAAASDIMAERRERWRRLNDLEAAADDPLLLIYPEGSWREVDTHLELMCDGEIARAFERALKRDWYHHCHFGDDFVLNPWWETPYFVTDSGLGVEIVHHRTAEATGSWKAEPPLKNLAEDCKHLRFREVNLDRETTEQWFAAADEAFGDLLEIRRRADFFWSAGLTHRVIDLVGLEEFMLLMFDDPENLHGLMRFLMEEQRHYMRQLEALGIVYTNNGAWHVGSGDLGFTSALPALRDGEKAKGFRNSWGLLESQETVGVSPEMFGEFIWPYQRELAKEFGLLYYGCCEPVEKRFAWVREAENLRAVSVSPWSDVRQCAELYGENYVLCCKPNPGFMCVDFCEAAIRKSVREIVEAAGHLNTAIIAKDLHTVSNDMTRYARWTQIAREEIKKRKK